MKCNLVTSWYHYLPSFGNGSILLFVIARFSSKIVQIEYTIKWQQGSMLLSSDHSIKQKDALTQQMTKCMIHVFFQVM